MVEIRTLHDAAEALAPVIAEVERILDEAHLLERAHHLAVADAGAIVEGLTDDETEQAMAVASGWRAYFDAVDRLRDMLGAVEYAATEARLDPVAHLYGGGDR